MTRPTRVVTGLAIVGVGYLILAYALGIFPFGEANDDRPPVIVNNGSISIGVTSGDWKRYGRRWINEGDPKEGPGSLFVHVLAGPCAGATMKGVQDIEFQYEVPSIPGSPPGVGAVLVSVTRRAKNSFVSVFVSGVEPTVNGKTLRIDKDLVSATFYPRRVELEKECSFVNVPSGTKLLSIEQRRSGWLRKIIDRFD